MDHRTGYDEEEFQPGFWERLRERFSGGSDEEEFDDPAPRRRPHIRIDQGRTHVVAIRRHPASISDAKIVADGLKSGQQQIVNLESAPVERASRVLDFLSGVVYALDGSVEKVGEKVYLFAPANVRIQLENQDGDG